LGPWKCYTRTNKTKQTPQNTNSYLSRNAFQVRVKVCDTDALGNLLDVRSFGTRNGVPYGLCSPYSDGNGHTIYKPTGAIQAYADQVRLAAFGYLTDSATDTYGGVLRAPIKFVGNRTFNEVGVDTTPSGGNPKREWDPVTGILVSNPDDDVTIPLRGASAQAEARTRTQVSGVINYINQFGRRGPIPGYYKQYGAVGELFYEAMRYLQGMTPTPAAVANVSDKADGLPVYTTWDVDPYGGSRTASGNYACRKANIVVAGTIQSYDSNALLTRAANVAKNLPDIAAWNTVVADLEGKNSGTYTDGAGQTQSSSLNPNTANTNAQLGANRFQGPLVGAAYWAHTHDIRGSNWTAEVSKQRPGLRVTSFFLDINKDFESFDGAYEANLDDSSSPDATRRNTFRRQQNQFFTAAKYGGFAADPINASKLYVSGANDPKSYNSHGNPFYRDDMTTADNKVWTDTRPARGNEARTYFVLTDGQAVLSGINAVFEDTIKAAANIAGVSAQSNQFSTQSGNTIYQARFDRNDWSGDIWAIPLTVNADKTVSVPTIGADGSGTSWSASAKLAARADRATTRNIVLGGGDTKAAIDFSTGMSKDDKKQFTVATTTIGAGRAVDRINYLRGDSSLESAGFRPRNGNYLGDIVNSAVVYGGAPTTAISDDGYAAFYNSNKTRTQVVYAGSNDGMLHAFVTQVGQTGSTPATNLTPGDELFAYIPSWVSPSLPELTDPAYNRHHRPFVDATPVVGEAKVGSDWKTVLVGGLGGGGRAVYALDVTDPTRFSKDKVLWEFSNASDVGLGNVVGTPQILKLRTDTKNNTYQWFAVVASGVNNYVPDSNKRNSSTGQPALFLLDLSKKHADAWKLGSNYFKISLPIDSRLGNTVAPGLVNFNATLGVRGEVTAIYAGDLHGQLWKLDFSSVGSADWTMKKLSFYKASSDPDSDPIPMYVAKDANRKVQPVSAAPALTYGPDGRSTFVTIGTGRYMDAGDQMTADPQTLYILFDNGTPTPDATDSITAAISGRGRLAQGSQDGSTGIITTASFTPGRPGTDADASSRAGWYLDFTHNAERQVSNPIVVGNQVVFSTLAPLSSTNTSVCEGGTGYLYSIGFMNGHGTSTASPVGILGAPIVLELGAVTYSDADSTGRKLKTIVTNTIAGGAGGVKSASQQSHTLAAGRLSWRQISDYYSLKDAK
jgi:type IV pilus assembly protein PilY1